MGRWLILSKLSKVGIRTRVRQQLIVFLLPKIELAIRSVNASSERDATSVMANSERGEHIGITAPFENVSEKNVTLHVFNTNDETRNNILDEVIGFSVPGTHFDRQSHTHHNNIRADAKVDFLRKCYVLPSCPNKMNATMFTEESHSSSWFLLISSNFVSIFCNRNETFSFRSYPASISALLGSTLS